MSYNFGTTPAAGGYSFGTPSAASSAATQGFSFGTTPAATNPGVGLNLTTAAKPATGAFSFGPPAASAPSAAAGFTFAPAPTSSTTATPAGAFSFGTKPAATPATSGGFSLAPTPATSSGFNLAPTAAAPGGFNLAPNPAAPAGFNLAPNPAAPAGFNLAPNPAAPGGYSLGATPAPSGGFSLTDTKPPPAAAPPGGFSFTTPGVPAGLNLTGSVGAPQIPSTGPGSTHSGSGVLAGLLSGTSGTATTQALPPPSLGTTTSAAPTLTLPATAAVPSVSKPAAPLTGFNFAGAGTTPLTAVSTSAVVGTTTSAATSSTVLAGSGPVMTYRHLEESVNKWSLELEDQESEFLKLATQVNAWDRLLIDNGEKITTLNTDVEKVKLDQQRLDHELDFIQTQQKELEDILLPLEKSLEQLPAVGYQQHADLERERTYQMAETMDGQLKSMVTDLKDIIEHLNQSAAGSDTNDPLQQMSKILNAHMDSLQWVDQNTVLVHRRVEEIGQLTNLRRQDQERSFKRAYD